MIIFDKEISKQLADVKAMRWHLKRFHIVHKFYTIVMLSIVFHMLSKSMSAFL